TEIHPKSLVQVAFLNSPISTSLLVIINNGNIENGKAKAKKTWEFSINMLMAWCCCNSVSPAVMATHKRTGTTDNNRVISRRAHSGIRMWMNPSMITCPVKLPVIVEFCVEAKKATAKSVDKTPDLATAIKTPLLNIEVLFNASYKPKKELSITAPDLKTATPMIKSKA